MYGKNENYRTVAIICYPSVCVIHNSAIQPGFSYVQDLAELTDDTHLMSRSGGRLNKKDGLTRYGNSHVKDKTS